MTQWNEGGGLEEVESCVYVNRMLRECCTPRKNLRGGRAAPNEAVVDRIHGAAGPFDERIVGHQCRLKKVLTDRSLPSRQTKDVETLHRNKAETRSNSGRVSKKSGARESSSCLNHEDRDPKREH